MTIRSKTTAFFLCLGIFALTGCVAGGAEHSGSGPSGNSGENASSATSTPPPPVTPTMAGESLFPPASGDLVSIITADIAESDLEVTAIIVDVMESDGTCTLTAARGDARLTREVTVQSTPNGTYCGLMSIDLDELTSGTWEMQVSYVSAKTNGRSEPKLVEVK